MVYIYEEQRKNTAHFKGFLVLFNCWVSGAQLALATIVKVVLLYLQTDQTIFHYDYISTYICYIGNQPDHG